MKQNPGSLKHAMAGEAPKVTTDGIKQLKLSSTVYEMTKQRIKEMNNDDANQGLKFNPYLAAMVSAQAWVNAEYSGEQLAPIQDLLAHLGVQGTTIQLLRMEARNANINQLTAVTAKVQAALLSAMDLATKISDKSAPQKDDKPEQKEDTDKGSDKKTVDKKQSVREDGISMSGIKSAIQHINIPESGTDPSSLNDRLQPLALSSLTEVLKQIGKSEQKRKRLGKLHKNRWSTGTRALHTWEASQERTLLKKEIKEKLRAEFNRQASIVNALDVPASSSNMDPAIDIDALLEQASSQATQMAEALRSSSDRPDSREWERVEEQNYRDLAELAKALKSSERPD